MRVDALSSQVSTLQAQNAALQGNITGLQTQNVQLHGIVTGLQAQNAALFVQASVVQACSEGAAAAVLLRQGHQRMRTRRDGAVCSFGAVYSASSASGNLLVSQHCPRRDAWVGVLLRGARAGGLHLAPRLAGAVAGLRVRRCAAAARRAARRHHTQLRARSAICALLAHSTAAILSSRAGGVAPPAPPQALGVRARPRNPPT